MRNVRGVGAMEYKFRREIAIRSCRIRRFMPPVSSREISARDEGLLAEGC